MLIPLHLFLFHNVIYNIVSKLCMSVLENKLIVEGFEGQGHDFLLKFGIGVIDEGIEGGINMVHL